MFFLNKKKQHESNKKPIFIHSLWRSSSTYFLNKFQIFDNFITFTEPFHELLGGLSEQEIIQDYIEIKKTLKHPLTLDSYFNSYKSLLHAHPNKNGVKNYKCKLSLTNYFQLHNDKYQNRYLLSLIEYSKQQLNSRPVLGFTRSLGRLEKLKKHFNAYNIVLIRDPFSQFFSGIIQKQKYCNIYFLIQYICILSVSCHIPQIAIFCEENEIPKMKINTIEEFEHVYTVIQKLFIDNLELQMKSFILVYLLSYAKSLYLADILISIDLLTTNKVYQSNITAILKDHMQVSLDFSDCHCPFYKNDLRDEFESLFYNNYQSLIKSDELRQKLNNILLFVNFRQPKII